MSSKKKTTYKPDTFYYHTINGIEYIQDDYRIGKCIQLNNNVFQIADIEIIEPEEIQITYINCGRYLDIISNHSGSNLKQTTT